MTEQQSKSILDQLKEIIDSDLPTSFTTAPSRDTFMSVAGYPHYENVVSNILQFFFDSERSHGFGNLWFKSLLECYGISKEVADTCGIESVDREVVTDKRNRIDLIISSTEYLVTLENKIYASIEGNDLKDYRTYTKKELKNSIEQYGEREAIYIVLSLFDLSDVKKIGEAGFVNVTYSQLFAKIKENLGDYIENADNTWLAYMKDFMFQIEESGAQKMTDFDYEATKFLYEDYEGRKAFYDYFRNYKKETKNTFNELLTKIKESRPDLQQEPHSLWVYQSTYFYTCLVDDIEIPQSNSLALPDKKTYVVVECWPDASGWHFVLWLRGNKDAGPDLRNRAKAAGLDVVPDLWLGKDKGHNGAELRKLLLPLETDLLKVQDYFLKAVDTAVGLLQS